MKLRKITAYIDEKAEHIDGQEDIRTTIIPSGFRGGYIVVEEDPGYNLGVAYWPMKRSKELLKELQRLKGRKRRKKNVKSNCTKIMVVSRV